MWFWRESSGFVIGPVLSYSGWERVFSPLDWPNAAICALGGVASGFMIAGVLCWLMSLQPTDWSSAVIWVLGESHQPS